MSRRSRWPLRACLLLLGVRGAEAQAQETTEQARFLEAAVRAADRYRDRDEALADGFRRLGPDFPGMGVHWVQTGRIVSGVFSAERPAVLSYVEVDGVPTLVGLAYTLPLRADESPPADPFGVDAWHDHAGEVSEESFLLTHPSSVLGASGEFRLSMLHLWIPLANPHGLSAQNNWNLPYLRVGITPPAHASPLATRGLSLGERGVEYYRSLLYWAIAEGEPDRAVIDGALERAVHHADAWLVRYREGADPPSDQELEQVWHDLWAELEISLTREAYERVLPLRSGH